MRTLFLTSSGLNEKTMVLFWKCIGKEPINTKAILVPSAAVGNDGAREGIIVCMERLMNMGIPMNNILIYNLAFLLSDGYKRTYSSYISDIPVPFRLMSVQELTQYDMIAFCGGNAHTLLSEINRTGFSKPLKQAIENGLVYLGISAGSMIAAGNFSDGLGYLANPLIPHAEKESPFGDISKNDLIELADGYIVKLDLGSVRELVGLLRGATNNLNQIARRANETRSVYAADVEDMQARYAELWEAANKILLELAQIS